MAELACFLRATEAAGETVAFRNDAEDGEERVADDLFGFAAEKLLSGEVHARESAREILREDHVAGLFDQIAIACFETRAFQQARYFRDQASRVERNFEVVVSAGFQAGDGAFGVFLQGA